MERISLPSRAPSRSQVVAVIAACVVSVLLLGWMALAIDFGAGGPAYIYWFKRVVLTKESEKIYIQGELRTQRTLFRSGGVMVDLSAYAENAEKTDPWNPEYPYLYARALWREYTGNYNPDVGDARSNRWQLESLPPFVILKLRSAVRNEPLNAFYHQTLAEVLKTVEGQPGIVPQEIDDLLVRYPPQNTFGEVRSAELLIERNEAAYKELARSRYARALELVSADVESGLLAKETAEIAASFPALGPAMALRVVNGLTSLYGDYANWAAGIPDYPEAHWLVANQLLARGKAADAAKEMDRVVSSVNERLALQRATPLRRYLFDMVCPMSRPALDKHFLLSREYGMAAAVLKTRGTSVDVESALSLHRTMVVRNPGDLVAWESLCELLLTHADTLQREAAVVRATEPDKATALDKQALALVIEARDGVDVILHYAPRRDTAIDLRARILGKLPETPAP